MDALNDVIDAFRRKVAADGGLRGGILAFHLDGLGVVTVNGTKSPNEVMGHPDARDAPQAECIVRMSVESLQALIQGKITGTDAVSNGKIEIEGDLRVAMAFGPAVGDPPTPINTLQFPFDGKWKR